MCFLGPGHTLCNFIAQQSCLSKCQSTVNYSSANNHQTNMAIDIAGSSCSNVAGLFRIRSQTRYQRV